MIDKPVIALIHATPAAVAPTVAGFATAFPEATLWNLLDDRLITDAARDGMTPRLRSRMLRLVDHAVREQADAVLMTCSMYGSMRAIAAPLHPIPVQAADDALFDVLLDASTGYGLLLTNTQFALDDSMDRLCQQANLRETVANVVGRTVPSVGADLALTVRTMRDVVEGHCPGVDRVALGQYSLAPAAPGLSDLLGVPVLSGPLLAAQRLRDLLHHQPVPHGA